MKFVQLFLKFEFLQLQIMENLKLETEIQRELSCMCLRSVGSIDVSVPANSHKNQVQEFFLLMAICNTVVVSLHPHEDIVSNLTKNVIVFIIHNLMASSHYLNFTKL